jgi:hypothetical protein
VTHGAVWIEPMPSSYITLVEHPSDMVRLACTKCEHRGQYRKSTLIERYGPDKNMVDLRLKLAAGCPATLWTMRRHGRAFP